MALFDTLDIPPGLEDLFNKLFSVGNEGTTLGMRNAPGVPSAAKRNALNSRSLFRLWGSTYSGLSGARHIAWTAYWETLSFGSHTGSGGWPGSGFSAFVYFNAARRRLGLGLQYDPPSVLGAEILSNPDFASNADGWTLQYGAYWSAGKIFCDATPSENYYALNILQAVSGGLVLGTYRMQAVVKTPSAFSSYYSAVAVGVPYSYFEYNQVFGSTGGVATLITKDFYNPYTQSGNFVVRIEGEQPASDVVFVESVSLKKYS